MDLAVHQIAIELRVKGAFDLGRGATEKDLGAGAGVAVHRQALRLQPGRNFREIALAHAEARGVLLRSQPLVIVRRVRVLLFGQQLIQRGLLLGGDSLNTMEA